MIAVSHCCYLRHLQLLACMLMAISSCYSLWHLLQLLSWRLMAAPIRATTGTVRDVPYQYPGLGVPY